jgi:bifunctional polynucleotide phosphatase/kinase
LLKRTDDTNIDVESRSIWISIAAKHQIAADAVFFMSSTDLCLHNDSVRALGGPLVRTDYFMFTCIFNMK